MKLRDKCLKYCFVSSGRSLRSKIPEDLVSLIHEGTSYLPAITKISDRIYAILNCQTENNLCLVCNEILIPKAYSPQLYCNAKCSSQSKITLLKRRTTCLRKYGVDNVKKDSAVQARTQETCMVRYGVDNPLKSPKILDKLKATNQKRYGVNYTLESTKIQALSKATCLQKYGLTNAGGHPSVQAKTKSTMLDRYGVENPGQSELIRAKILKTNKDRYNAGTKSPLNPKQLRVLRDPILLDSMYNGEDLEPIDIAKDLKVSIMTVWNYLHLHNIKVKPSTRISRPERRIQKLIENNYEGIILFNDRLLIKPYELDIYLPELGLAIEYNGLYWHSENQGKGRSYHLDKTLACADRDVQLLHIFSSDPPDIWDSVLLAKLGKTINVGARKCEIKEVSNDDAYVFLHDNHLQGPVNGSIRYGLYYQTELISLMTFSKSRFKSSSEYELLRFCNKKGYRVMGAASKLWKHANLTSCVSYANMRWSTGDLYDKLGFCLINRSLPNYFYTNDYTNIHSRQKFQKHKLSNLLDNFDSELSESQNMLMNGYDRIYDCGNLVYSSQ